MFCSVSAIEITYWLTDRAIRHHIIGDETGMAGLLGKIEQYDPEEEEWPQYVERLE